MRLPVSTARYFQYNVLEQQYPKYTLIQKRIPFYWSHEYSKSTLIHKCFLLPVLEIHEYSKSAMATGYEK